MSSNLLRFLAAFPLAVMVMAAPREAGAYVWSWDPPMAVQGLFIDADPARRWIAGSEENPIVLPCGTGAFGFAIRNVDASGSEQGTAWDSDSIADPWPVGEARTPEGRWEIWINGDLSEVRNVIGVGYYAYNVTERTVLRLKWFARDTGWHNGAYVPEADDPPTPSDPENPQSPPAWVDSEHGIWDRGGQILIVMDCDSPDIAVLGPTAEGAWSTNSSDLALSGVAGDSQGLQVITYSSDRGATGSLAGESPWYADVPLEQGANVVTVTAVDHAGNVASDTITVDCDSAAPTFAGITATPAQLTLSQPVTTIEFEASEELAGDVVVAVNNRPAQLVTSANNHYSFTYTRCALDAPGPATISISGVDLAGNTGTATSTSALSVALPPAGPNPNISLSIAAPVANATEAGDVLINVSVGYGSNWCTYPDDYPGSAIASLFVEEVTGDHVTSPVSIPLPPASPPTLHFQRVPDAGGIQPRTETWWTHWFSPQHHNGRYRLTLKWTCWYYNPEGGNGPEDYIYQENVQTLEFNVENLHVLPDPEPGPTVILWDPEEPETGQFSIQVADALERAVFATAYIYSSDHGVPAVPVRELAPVLSPQPTGAVAFAWDGKDSAGEMQPRGVYVFDVQVHQEEQMWQRFGVPGAYTFARADVANPPLDRDGRCGRLVISDTWTAALGASPSNPLTQTIREHYALSDVVPASAARINAYAPDLTAVASSAGSCDVGEGHGDVVVASPKPGRYTFLVTAIEGLPGATDEGYWSKNHRVRPALEANSNREMVRRVWVDAGHGGDDPGTIWPQQSQPVELTEAEVTAAHAEMLKLVLQVSHPREYEIPGCDPAVRWFLDHPGLARQYFTYEVYTTVPRTLKAEHRPAVINKADPDLVISLHVDSVDIREVPDPPSKGSIYWYKTTDHPWRDDILYYTGISSQKGKALPSTVVALQKGFYMVKNVYAPSLLLELGMMPNAEDRARLQTPETRRVWSDVIHSAMDSYFTGVYAQSWER